MRLPWLVVLVPLVACGPDESTGACKDSFVAGDLVITEVFADFAAPIAGSSGADDGKEWLEIYNNSDRPVSLKGVTVVHSKIDGSDGKSHTVEDVTIAPGQFFTLGNATQDLLPAYIDYGYSADLGDLSNTTGGKLALKCGSQEIDVADYDTVKSGHSRQLTSQSPPDYTLNDDQVNWCEAKDTEFETNNFGTPGSDSDCAPVIAGLCSDAGTQRDAVKPMLGDLVITEVMPNPAGNSDTTAEWIEVVATRDVDLNGLAIDRVGDTAGASTINSPTCLRVAAGQYAVFSRSDMTTGLPGGVTPVGQFSLSLVDGTMAAPADVQIMIDGTVLDAITWTSTRSGRSHQLSPDRYDVAQNDDETAFCDGTSQYFMNGTGTDYGTPGAANIACPATVGPGQCIGTNGPRDIVPPPTGMLVITELMPRPATADNGAAEWFEVTNIGGASFDLNGIGIDRDGDSRAPDVITSTDCKSLAPGGYALFARGTSTATNGGLPTVDATFGFGLLNANGNVRVVDPTSCELVSPYQCTTIYDSVAYTTTSVWTMFATAGVSAQLDQTMLTTTANDTVANYCAGSADYGTGGKGTPRAINTCP